MQITVRCWMVVVAVVVVSGSGSSVLVCVQVI